MCGDWGKSVCNIHNSFIQVLYNKIILKYIEDAERYSFTCYNDAVDLHVLQISKVEFVYCRRICNIYSVLPKAEKSWDRVQSKSSAIRSLIADLSTNITAWAVKSPMQPGCCNRNCTIVIGITCMHIAYRKCQY